MYLKSERTHIETATTRTSTVLAIVVSDILEVVVYHFGVVAHKAVNVTTISDSVSEVLEPLTMTMLATVHLGDTQLEWWEMMISALVLPA